MVAKDLARGLDPQEQASLLSTLGGEFPLGIDIHARGVTSPIEGPLMGGCLSLLTSVLGTAFEPDLTGSILFWEDVDEPLYRLDRMLIHLQLSGRLSCVSGMVVGRIRTQDGADDREGLQSLLDEWADRLPVPLVADCPSGHCQPNLTLPLGIQARIDPAAKTLLVGTSTD